MSNKKKIFIPMAVMLIAHICATSAKETPKSDQDNSPLTEKITISDARDKRQLSNFDDNYKQQPSIQRRITSNYQPFSDPSSNYVNQYNNGYEFAGSYPNVQSYGPTYSVQPSQYVGGYQQQQYVEAPEPIIEIIIKDSNETLPPPEPIQFKAPKKKKEEVQVFYVKYNKDEKKGLVIDDPIPALSPAAFNHDESEEEEQHDEPYVQPTLPPPVRTTTLRTIIKPESELYHSNSGIQVTFNTESKHQTGHEFQEHFEGSELQPIIADLRNPNNEHQPPSVQFVQPSLPPNRQFNNNERARAFEIQYNNHAQNAGSPPQPSFHRFAPPSVVSHSANPHPTNPHPANLQSSNPSNSPQFFRPSPEQGLLLSYTQNQQNRFYQPQNFENPRIKNIPSPNAPVNPQRFSEPQVINFPPFANKESAPPGSKFRPQSSQPKPIPIPLHHHEKGNQAPHATPGQPQQVNHHQHYTNYQQFSKHSHHQQPQQYRLKQQSHQTASFQQSFPQPVRSPNAPHLHGIPNESIPSNHRLVPSTGQPHQSHQPHAPIIPSQPTSFQSPEQIHNNVLFQQKAPNLASHVHNSFINQPNQQLFAGNTQDFNRVVSGAELVESLPKFEQHITETVPLSEINKPFSPFRQLQSVQSSSGPINSNVQPQKLHHPQEQHLMQASQQTQNEQLIQQSFEHAKLLHQQRQQQQEQQQQHHQHHQHHQQHQQQQQQHQQHQQIYHQQNNGIQTPQIVFPVNYHNKNYQFQDQTSFNLNAIPSQPTRPTAIFNQKVIPGKGVSNLAQDVFGDLAKSQHHLKGEPDQHIDSRNHYSVHQTISAGQQPTVTFSAASTERNYVSTYPQLTDVRKVTIPSSISPSTTTTQKPPSKKITADLPDEVPDDLRQQLLSSGILENADISILDYDKVGDIPLESLPPEHLANFYGAGGASQISSSNRVLNIVKPNGDSVTGLQYTDDDKSEEKKFKTLPKKQNVDLKVVRFDSSNQKSVTDKYIRQDSTVLPTIDINQAYNRYLPLKVNGDSFPIPDIETLRNKKISSVVVLAPVDSLSGGAVDDEDVIEDGRYERDVIDSKEVKFLAGDSLKTLLRKPTKENFKRWLDKEAKTNVDMQSVVLLVVKNETNGQEIYMYDIGTKIVSRLKGELSTAFVNVAESNANAQEEEDGDSDVTISDSGIYEKMPAMNSEHEKITIIEAQSSSPKHHRPIFRRDSAASTATHQSNDRISISSGYSVIKR